MMWSVRGRMLGGKEREKKYVKIIRVLIFSSSYRDEENTAKALDTDTDANTDLEPETDAEAEDSDTVTDTKR